MLRAGPSARAARVSPTPVGLHGPVKLSWSKSMGVLKLSRLNVVLSGHLLDSTPAGMAGCRAVDG